MLRFPFDDLGQPPDEQEPFPAYPRRVIEIVEKAICMAWQQLVAEGRLDLRVAREDTITKALQVHLVDIMNKKKVKGYDARVFGQPGRGSAVPDYTETRLNKQPDLTFTFLSARPLAINRGLFYECKSVGPPGEYLGPNGIGRFTEGDYASAMPHAGMLAYVQRKKEPLTAQVAIEAAVKNGALTVLSHFADTKVTYHPVHVSVHSRYFTLPNGKSPGEISIRHIWLTP